MQSWQVLSTPALTVIHSLEHNSPVIVVTLGVWWQFAKWKPSVFTWLPSAVWKHFNQREYCAVAYSKCLKIYLVVKVHCSNLSPQSGTPWVIIEFRWLFEQENHPNEIFSKLLELNSFLFLFFWLFFFSLILGQRFEDWDQLWNIYLCLWVRDPSWKIHQCKRWECFDLVRQVGFTEQHRYYGVNLALTFMKIFMVSQFLTNLQLKAFYFFVNHFRFGGCNQYF